MALVREGLIYNFAPQLRVYRVLVDSASRVPRVAARLLALRGARAGLYNVPYRARLALDVQGSGKYGILGLPTPLAFLPRGELEESFASVVERVGDLRVAVFDVEVYNRSGFPRRGDPVIVLSYATARLGDELELSDAEAEARVEVYYAARPDEGESRELVERLARLLERDRPDIVAGYNSSAFDVVYMKPFAPQGFDPAPAALRVGGLSFPHLDLMDVRVNHGVGLGLRSHTSRSLEDVAMDAARAAGLRGWEGLPSSRMLRAERTVNKARIHELYERRDPILDDYSRADAFLTLALALAWAPPLLALSALSGVPLTVLQGLNPGQLGELLLAELHVRLGLYPELAERRYDYGKTSAPPPEAGEHAWVFTRGKTYAAGPGFYGGDGLEIVELDFSQLYPSDMVNNPVDPTVNPEGPRGFPVLLRDPAGGQVLVRVEGSYGPAAWIVSRLHSARRITKRMKREGRAGEALDQAVKILANATIGAFSKTRGNLLSELVTATIFWRTQKLFYEVIGYVEGELSRLLGVELRVLYGDTDSVYILAPRGMAGELERRVNEWVRSRYGENYVMKLEDVYDAMVIPRLAEGSRASAKSYITLKREGGRWRVAKIKGEFFKLHAPAAIKERLVEFYELLLERVRDRRGLEELVRSMLEAEPPHKWFIRVSVSSLVSEDDPRRLKRLNKPFHYAALFELLRTGSEGVEVLERRDSYTLDGGRVHAATVRVDPRRVEGSQRAVVVSYLPHPSGDPRKFLLYAGDDGEKVEVDVVSMRSLSIESQGTGRGSVELAYLATFTWRRVSMGREELLGKVLESLETAVFKLLERKLLPVLPRG